MRQRKEIEVKRTESPMNGSVNLKFKENHIFLFLRIDVWESLLQFLDAVPDEL